MVGEPGLEGKKKVRKGAEEVFDIILQDGWGNTWQHQRLW